MTEFSLGGKTLDEDTRTAKAIVLGLATDGLEEEYQQVGKWRRLVAARLGQQGRPLLTKTHIPGLALRTIAYEPYSLPGTATR
jgi:hypothetical protein